MDNIIIVILGTFTLSFAIAYASVLYRLSRLTQESAKLFISHQSLQNFVEKNDSAFKNDVDIHKENFIKFLSDSRDWAFAYIEEVQKGLENFILKVDKDIDYFDNYSSISEGTAENNLLKNISKEYKELKKLMPAETVKDA